MKKIIILTTVLALVTAVAIPVAMYIALPKVGIILFIQEFT